MEAEILELDFGLTGNPGLPRPLMERAGVRVKAFDLMDKAKRQSLHFA